MSNSKADDVCMMLQNRLTATFFLHDTVYLYLRTVNQTVAEANSDLFRDGRYIRNKTIGQRFTGWFPIPIDLLPRDAMLARYIPSLCVCLYVTSRCSTETAKRRITRTIA